MYRSRFLEHNKCQKKYKNGRKNGIKESSCFIKFINEEYDIQGIGAALSTEIQMNEAT